MDLEIIGIGYKVLGLITLRIAIDLVSFYLNEAD